MRLEDEDTGYNLQLVPGTYGMNVRSACTIVIIAGKNRQKNLQIYQANISTSTSEKYLGKVDRVMTQVDRITEDIAHMPLAAFIFRDRESDEVHYSPDIRSALITALRSSN